MISLFQPDEHAQYPALLFMLNGNSLKQTVLNFILYRYYYYGFPFFASSALVLLPLKLANALNGQNVQLAMLLLRQLINVLPMTLAILLMVYSQTKFRSYFTSILTFIFLLLIAAVVENNLWWHADSLTVLFVVLVFFFLDRDQLKFDINFRLAAIACGLAIGTKVLGFFFFIAIPVYILIGIQQKQISWQKALQAAAVFVALMVLVVVASNPFLLIQSERQEMLRLVSNTSHDMTQGYTFYYVKSPFSWLSVLASLAKASIPNFCLPYAFDRNMEIVQAGSSYPDPLLGHSIFLLYSLLRFGSTTSLLPADSDSVIQLRCDSV